MTVRIECIDVVKRYGTTPVLDRLSWTVAPGQLAGLLGGSGAGKTTLLRLIAGLEECSAGRVTIHAPQSAGANRRMPIGMVFQNLALWPHLSARRHLECVLPRLARGGRRRRAEALLAETRLPPAVWDRRPAQLSGGEAQRLALARALAPQPNLLLLDEPLAQLDTTLRAALLELIREVIRARGVTAIYVTHHWSEAMTLCERIAVMGHGRIAMDETPEEVYWNPPTPQVARLTGPVVELSRELLERGLITRAPGPPCGKPGASQPADLLVVRPQQLQLIAPAGPNRWELAACRPEGAAWTLTLVHREYRLSMPSLVAPTPGKVVGVELTTPGTASLRGCTQFGKRES